MMHTCTGHICTAWPQIWATGPIRSPSRPSGLEVSTSREPSPACSLLDPQSGSLLSFFAICLEAFWFSSTETHPSPTSHLFSASCNGDSVLLLRPFNGRMLTFFAPPNPIPTPHTPTPMVWAIQHPCPSWIQGRYIRLGEY